MSPQEAGPRRRGSELDGLEGQGRLRGRRRRELAAALTVGARGGAGFGGALWLLGRLLGLA